MGGKEPGEVEGDITLAAILRGETRSPITVEDLKSYLAVLPQRAAELAAVEFLLTFDE